jgi:FKBP-type peptidyl-prolyl cis-trans isomerase SlyD
MTESPMREGPSDESTPGQVVADDLVVSLAYTLRDDEGELIDSAPDEEPLEYIQGYGQIITGLEDEIYGMSLGDEKDLIIAPENAYGEYDPEASQVAPLDAFPQEMELEIGDDAEDPIEGFIADIYDDSVLLDFNHPLAGETLHFHVKVVGLREASAEELDHGHVHGAGHEH